MAKKPSVDSYLEIGLTIEAIKRSSPKAITSAEWQQDFICCSSPAPLSFADSDLQVVASEELLC